MSEKLKSAYRNLTFSIDIENRLLWNLSEILSYPETNMVIILVVVNFNQAIPAV